MARGDHIFRDGLGGVYTHHGIDLGDGRVIQYSGLASPGRLSGCVTIVSMEEFAADYEVKAFLYPAVYRLNDGSEVILDITHTPDEIVARALSREGEDCYALFANNCEHFCHWAVSGDHRCGQLMGRSGRLLSQGNRPSGSPATAVPQQQRPEEAAAAILGRLPATATVPPLAPVAVAPAEPTIPAPDHPWLAELRPLFEQMEALRVRHGAGLGTAGERQALAAEMAEFRLCMPLVGAFSSGKSTLLNAWLRGAAVLPAALGATTRTPLEIVHGPSARLLARDPQTGATTELPGLDPASAPRGVDQLELQLPGAPLLGLDHSAVVDLPGLDSGESSHDVAVARYAPRAAAFILVVDGERLLMESVLHTLETLRTMGAAVRVVLTKADLFSPSLVREKVRAIGAVLAPRLGDAWDGVVRVTGAGRGDVAEFDLLLHQLHATGPSIARRRFAARLLPMARAMRHALVQVAALQAPEDGEFRRVRLVVQGHAAKLRVEVENFRGDLRRQIDRVLEDIRFDLEDSFAERVDHYAHVTDARALNESLRKMAGAELRRLLEIRLIPAFAAATRTSPREVEAGLANLQFAPGGDTLTDLIARGVGLLRQVAGQLPISLPTDSLLAFLTGRRDAADRLRNAVMPQLV